MYSHFFLQLYPDLPTLPIYRTLCPLLKNTFYFFLKVSLSNKIHDKHFAASLFCHQTKSSNCEYSCPKSYSTRQRPQQSVTVKKNARSVYFGRVNVSYGFPAVRSCFLYLDFYKVLFVDAPSRFQLGLHMAPPRLFIARFVLSEASRCPQQQIRPFSIALSHCKMKPSHTGQMSPGFPSVVQSEDAVRTDDSNAQHISLGEAQTPAEFPFQGGHVAVSPVPNCLVM